MHPESPSKTEDIELLAPIGLFADLSEGEIEEIIGDILARTAGKGTVLYAADDGPAELYLLGEALSARGPSSERCH